MLLLLLLLPVTAGAAPVTMSIRGHQVSLDVFTVFSSPGEKFSIGLIGQDVSRIRVLLGEADYGRAGDGQWHLEAPSLPGVYPLNVRHLDSGNSTLLNVFVGVPASDIEDGYLNGYRVGPAPPGNPRFPVRYRAPEHFYEVTPEIADLALSPGFHLGQFLCKQTSAFPKYVALNESLLVLLEAILKEAQSRGHEIDTLGIISGYRTPYYNRKIGNVANSRHVYGDALDFFIDEDRDGLMDDLNDDGVRNRADVDVLFKLVEDVKAKTDNALLVGGLGRYYQTSRHGGFVHVDTRGYRARW